MRSLKEVLISDEQRSKYIYIYIYICGFALDINNGSSLGLWTCMEANKLRLVLIYAKLMQNLCHVAVQKSGLKTGNTLFSYPGLYPAGIPGSIPGPIPGL